jgi:hypothetical protein
MPPANHNKTTSRPRKIGDQIGPGGLRGSNLFAHVETLQALLQRDQPDLLRPFEQQLSEFGSWVRSVVNSQAEYRDAQAQPRLESYDRRGNTINRVQHNPPLRPVPTRTLQAWFGRQWCRRDPPPNLIGFNRGHLLGQADLSLQPSGALTATVALGATAIYPGRYAARVAA